MPSLKGILVLTASLAVAVYLVNKAQAAGYI